MFINNGPVQVSPYFSSDIFLSIYNLIPTPVYLWQCTDDDFKLIHYNDAAFKITEGKIAGRLGVLASQFYINDPDVFDLYTQCKSARTTILKEWNYDFKTIKVKKPIRAQFTFLEPDIIVAVVEDLSDKMNYKAELEEQRNQLALFVEHSPAALAMFDTEMKYIHCSTRWLSDYNLTVQDIIGKSHYEVFPEIGKEWKDIHQRCLGGNVEKREEDYFVRLDGLTDWMRWEIHPWRKANGEIGGIIMFTEVITQRKMLEEKIKQNEFRLKFATQAGKIGIWDYDLHSNELIWDEEMYRLYGLQESESPITYDYWINHCLHPEDKDALTAQIDTAIRNATDFVVEFRIIQPSGNVLYIKSESRALQDECGKSIRIIGLNRDITKKKLAFQTLQEVNLTVVERVKELKCLYRISEICRKSESSLAEILESTLPIIANAYRFYEVTCVRIEFQNEIFCTNNFEETDWVQSASIYVNKEKRGRVDVFYLEEMPEADEGPFSNEERLLINSIADIFGNLVELKESSLSLTKSEEKYRYLFDHNPALIMIWDLESLQICEVNQKVIDIYGYTREEFIGLSVLAYRPPEDHERIINFAKEMLRENVSVQEKRWRHLKKNGEEMIMEISSHKINYQNRPAILSLARDVTQQIKIEFDLQQSEERYHALIEYAADAIFMINDSGVVFNVNQSALELLQKSKLQLIGQKVSSLQLIGNDSSNDINGEVSKKYEKTIIRQDNSVVDVEISQQIIPDGSGAIVIARDITERNFVLSQIKKSELRMTSLLQNSPVPLAVSLADGSIKFINKQYTETFGYTLNDVPTVANWWELAYPDLDYRKKVMLEWEKRSQKYFTKKGPFDVMEAKVQCKDGTFRYIEFSLAILGEEMLIIFHDITHRKKLEKELIQREEKFRALTDNITDAIVLSDFEDKIIYRSPATQKITGYDNAQPKSIKLFDLVHPDDRDRYNDGLQLLKNNGGGGRSFQLRLMHKDGRIVWVEGAIINLLHNESVGAIVCNFRDITERRKAEEQLALSSLIINSTDDAIISKSTDGIITSWNNGAQKLLGYTAEQAIGKSILMLIPQYLHHEEKALTQKITQKITVNHSETSRIRKDGSILIVSLTHSPILNDKDEVIGVSTIMRDITTQKLLEQEKTKVIQDLTQRNRDLEQFSYIVSHNLRAPLANIIGLSDILFSLEKNKIDVVEVNSELSKSVHQLDEVIKDLNFILQTRSSINEQRNEVNLNELLSEITLSMNNLILKEQAVISYDFSATQVIVSIKSFLYSIFYNLLTNSIKYRQAGHPPIIEIKSKIEDGALHIFYKDNGLGIDMDKKGSQVFGLYKRFHTHTDGRGMGLYMVKTQVEALGGLISLKSEVNVGSEFHIVLKNY